MTKDEIQKQREKERALITDKNLAALSIADLAECAGVSRQTLYKHHAKLLLARERVAGGNLVLPSETIKKTERRIRETNLSITEICRRGGLSRTAFYKKIPSAKGTRSPGVQDVSDAKIRKIMKLAKAGKKPVMQICKDEGVSHMTYYRRRKMLEAKASKPSKPAL